MFQNYHRLNVIVDDNYEINVLYILFRCVHHIFIFKYFISLKKSSNPEFLDFLKNSESVEIIISPLLVRLASVLDNISTETSLEQPL